MRFFKRQSNVLILLLCTCSVIVFYFSRGQTSSNPFFGFKYAQRLLSYGSSPPCACNRCLTESENDLWFVKHFKQSLNPFMTGANKILPGDTIKWWKTLQNDRGNLSKVVEELFQLIPDKGLYLDAGPERCRTCAVVGNSGNLKGSHYGALIDLNDVIIRINKASTEGFEEDVGTRTTHHVMYPESAVDLDNTTHLVLVPFKTLDLQWLLRALTTGSTVKHTYAPIKARIKANKDLVMVLNPTFMKYVHEIWLEKHGRYPSTGFMALIYALHICDEVNVYGFGADRYGNWHHYWDPLPSRLLAVNSEHGRNHEYHVTMQLSKRHKIHIFKGQ